MKFIRVVLASVVLLQFSCRREEPVSGTTTVSDTGTTIAVTETPATDTAAAPLTQGPVGVTLAEYRIEMPDTLAAGSLTFEVTNSGARRHNFEIEGAGIEQKLERDLESGETATLQIDLVPGTYRVYCPVGDHAEEHGMSRQLTVR
jgi:uncharacterized cupredoxin-like copper-binding protein